MLLQKDAPTRENIKVKMSIEKKINKCLEFEETLWYQRSRINWLKEASSSFNFAGRRFDH